MSEFYLVNVLVETTARILKSINEVPAAHWDAFANPENTAFDPFLTHAFLAAVEDSGSAVSATGWQPFHLQVLKAGDTLGYVPMYAKGHSQGEYVFDYSWADAWQRAGGHYYPKLQVCIPFTPATGRRLLTRKPCAESQQALLSACVQVADQIDVSSLHLTFLTESEWELTGGLGFLKRMDQQFHWHNPGYACFDEFLGDLSSKKRKNLRRERRDAVANDIEVEWVTGDSLTETHWDAFYQFYMDTGARKWGRSYLTRNFFSLISERMPDRVLLILAKRSGRYIAGSLHFIGGEVLYGRNWGCTEHHPFLHFELCYYQAMDFAIERGLKKVEAGAQGGHKVARGYLPEPTYSSHWIRDPGFRQAVQRFLEEEREYVRQDIDYIEQRSPFKSTVALDQIRLSMVDGSPDD